MTSASSGVSTRAPSSSTSTMTCGAGAADEQVGAARRAHQLAGREAGQPALALGLRAGVLQQRRGEHRGQEGHRGDAAPELLAEDRQLDPAQALAAVLLGDRDAGPPELAELAPQRVVGPARLGVLAHALGPGAVGEQLAGRALDVALVVGQSEVHVALLPYAAAAFSRGSPSTRSATMFLSTSVVPPSIVLPRARSSS